MLHHVAKVKVGLSNFIVGHLENSLGVLQCEPVTLKTLKCLSPSDERLNVLGIDLQDGRAIGNDSIEIGNLLVTR